MQRALQVDSEVGRSGMISGSSGREGSTRTKLLHRVLTIILIVVAVTGLFAAAYTFHFFGLGTTRCWARPASGPGSCTYFVVVMSNEGRTVGCNGSTLESGCGPFMIVT